MTEEKLKVITCPKCGEAINVEKLFEIFNKINDVKKEQKEWQMRYDCTLTMLEKTECEMLAKESILGNDEEDLKNILNSDKTITPAELEKMKQEMKSLKEEISVIMDNLKEQSIENTDNNQIKELEEKLWQKQSLLAQIAANALDKTAEINILKNRIESHKKDLAYLENKTRHLKVQKATYLDKLNDIEEKIQNLLSDIGE